MKPYIIAAISILAVGGIVFGIVRGIPYLQARQALQVFEPFPLSNAQGTYMVERDEIGRTFVIYQNEGGENKRVRALTAEQLAYGLSEQVSLQEFVPREGSRSAEVVVTGNFYCYKGGKQKIDTYTNVCTATQEPTLVIDTIEFAQ